MRKTLKHLFGTTVVALLGVSTLSACSSSKSGAKAPKQELTWMTTSEIQTMDPSKMVIQLVVNRHLMFLKGSID